MTYAVGGLIQASDFNGLATTLNSNWSVGSGNSGYGQPSVAPVVVGGIVYAAPAWSSLFNDMTAMASHQGTAISAITSPNPGNIIEYKSALNSNLVTINTNRLNAVAQGGTSSTTITNNIGVWDNTLTFVINATFASQNAVRYFFNAGGQLGLSFAHPTLVTTLDTRMHNVAANAGTMWLSSPISGTCSLAGTAYNGVTKIGGSSIGSTVNINNGFYSLSNTPTTLMIQQGSSAYYYYYYYGNNIKLTISATNNNLGQVTFTCVFASLPQPSSSLVSLGSTATLTVRPPSTTYISNTWGTPTITSSVTPVNNP